MRFLLPLLMLLFVPATVFAGGSTLELNISNINESSGRIRLALYGDEAHFGDETWAITIREKVANKDGVVIRVENLPAGNYAVMAYHDINRNRQFDRRMWLIAAEGYGLSNNPPVTEPVDFQTGTFEVDGDNDLVMEIKLNYCADKDVDKSLGRVLGCWISQSP